MKRNHPVHEYYLKKLLEDKIIYLGSSEDMYEVCDNLRAICSGDRRWWSKSSLRWVLDSPKACENNLLQNYNQTGKDEFYAVVREYSAVIRGIIVPQYECQWMLRPYLVVDETGRHISKDELRAWFDRYPHKSGHYCYCGFPSDYRRPQRLHWCSMLHTDLKNMDDSGDMEDVLEYAGAHTANKLMNRRKADISIKRDEDNWPNQPRRSWKRKKCRHQWQKYKPTHRDQMDMPVPVELDVADLASEIIGE